MEKKFDNSHLCELCTGDGLDAGQEICKPCQGTGIDRQYWAMEILKLQEKLHKILERERQRNIDSITEDEMQ